MPLSCPRFYSGLNVAAERGNNAENIQTSLQKFHSVSSSVRAGKWVSATLTTPMPKGLHNATAHNALRIYAWVCDRLPVQHSNSISSTSMRKKVLNSHFKRKINKLRQTKLKKKKFKFCLFATSGRRHSVELADVWDH